MKLVPTQLNSPNPPKSPIIRGIDVLTIVWSIAAVKRPSRVPAITTTFVRVLIVEIGWKVGAVFAKLSLRLDDRRPLGCVCRLAQIP